MNIIDIRTQEFSVLGCLRRTNGRIRYNSRFTQGIQQTYSRQAGRQADRQTARRARARTPLTHTRIRSLLRGECVRMRTCVTISREGREGGCEHQWFLWDHCTCATSFPALGIDRHCRCLARDSFRVTTTRIPRRENATSPDHTSDSQLVLPLTVNVSNTRLKMDFLQ